MSDGASSRIDYIETSRRQTRWRLQTPYSDCDQLRCYGELARIVKAGEVSRCRASTMSTMPRPSRTPRTTRARHGPNPCPRRPRPTATARKSTDTSDDWKRRPAVPYDDASQETIYPRSDTWDEFEYVVRERPAEAAASNTWPPRNIVKPRISTVWSSLEWISIRKNMRYSIQRYAVYGNIHCFTVEP